MCRIHMGPALVLTATILLVLVPSLSSRNGPQSVTLAVSVPPGMDVSGVAAEIQHAGSARKLKLTEQHSRDGRRLWQGEWKPGAPTLLLPVRILVTRQGATAAGIADTRLEILGAGRTELTWTLEVSVKPVAIRLSRARAVAHVRRSEAGWVLAKAAFAVAVLIVVLRVLAKTRGEPCVDVAATGRTGWKEGVFDIVFWLVLAAAWTWPAAVARDHWAVGRHCDVLSTAWAIDSAPRLAAGLKDTMTSWPLVGDYRRIDSFLLLLWSLALGGLGAVRVHGLLQVAGTAVSAWGAQGFAREVGARRPWDMIAGMSFALGGMPAHALLEGHMYHVVNPWLPLFALAWWRVLSGRGSTADALLAGMTYCLTLLTSAYMGIAAAVLAVGFCAGSMLKNRAFPWRYALTASAIVAPVLFAYVALCAGGPRLSRDMSSGTSLMASAHLLSLMGATPELDRVRHSLAVEISPVVLSLLVVAPVVLAGGRPYRTLVWTGVAGLVLACGPAFAVGPRLPICPTPLGLLLEDTPLDVLLRFPLRFACTWTLCAGAVAAVAATRLAARGNRWGWLLLVLAILHSFAVIRLPARQRVRVWETPVAYLQEGGPVLDLFPLQRAPFHFDGMWFKGMAAVYQMDHQRPIAEQCLATSMGENPRVVLGHWTTRRLLAGKTEEVMDMLSRLGFRDVVLHADYFAEQERRRLEAALAAFGTPRAVSTNGGVRVVAQRVPEPDSRTTRSEASAQYAEVLSETTSRGEEGLIETLHVAPRRVEDLYNGIAALIGGCVYLCVAVVGLTRHRRRRRPSYS